MVYEFGARLLQLRKAKNLTQQALVDRAKALDPDLRLSDSVLGNYESDHTVPRLTEAAALAEVLGVSLDFLTNGENSRTLPLKDLSDSQIQLLMDLTRARAVSSRLVCAGLLFGAALLIARLAPANNAALHLSEEESAAIRPRALARLAIVVLAGCALLCGSVMLANCVAVSLLAVAALLVFSNLGLGTQ